MEATHANQTLWAMVGHEIELGFISKGNLIFQPLHT
jgi:hypothetical protein